MKVKAIIVEDEPSAIQALQGMLGTFCPQVEVVSVAQSVEDGLLAVREHDPDLVFLDIEIPPHGKGFDLLHLLPDRRFGVIFTTAYSEYAIQAINDVQPWGYLTKPFRVADLVKAVMIAEQKVMEAAVENTETETEEIKGIIIPDSRKGNIVIRAKDILYCKADKGASDIFILNNGAIEKVTASRSLREIEEQLPSPLFCRTHNSYLVNLKHIVRYQRTGRNGIIYMPQGHRVDISVMKMNKFEEQFKKLLG